MMVFALPNREFPPAEDSLSLATVVLQSLSELTPALVQRVASDATVD